MEVLFVYSSLALVTHIFNYELHLEEFSTTDTYSEYFYAFNRISTILPHEDILQIQINNIVASSITKVQSKI